jgi:hypothetical protein
MHSFRTCLYTSSSFTSSTCLSEMLPYCLSVQCILFLTVSMHFLPPYLFKSSSNLPPYILVHRVSIFCIKYISRRNETIRNGLYFPKFRIFRKIVNMHFSFSIVSRYSATCDIYFRIVSFRRTGEFERFRFVSRNRKIQHLVSSNFMKEKVFEKLPRKMKAWEKFILG